MYVAHNAEELEAEEEKIFLYFYTQSVQTSTAFHHKQKSQSNITYKV